MPTDLSMLTYIALPAEGQVAAGPAKQHSAHSVQPKAWLAASAACVGAADQIAWRLSSQEHVRCPGC